MMTCSIPAATASSTAYWITGLSTRGSISFGWAFVAGRKRVPQPAAGKTALRTRIEPLGQVDRSRPVYPSPCRNPRGPPGCDGCGPGGRCVRGGRRIPSTKRATCPENARGWSRLERCMAQRDDDTAALPTRCGPVVATGREHRVQRPVDDQDGRPQPAEPLQEPAAHQGPDRARPTCGPEAAVDDRLGDRSAVPEPEEPDVEQLEDALRQVLQDPGKDAERERHHAEGLAGAARQHQARDAVRSRIRHLDRDEPAQREPDEDRPPGRHLGFDCGDHASPRGLDRPRLSTPLAVPGQVNRNAPVPRREASQLRPPLAARESRPVQEHDCRRIAGTDCCPGAASGRGRGVAHRRQHSPTIRAAPRALGGPWPGGRR